MSALQRATDIHWSHLGLCVGDPGGWDLDEIGGDKQAIREAQRKCRKECPVFAECTERMKGLKRGLRPQDQVLAGVVFRNKQLKKKPMPPCPKGHIRTPENTAPNGNCKECRRASNRDYQRRLREAARALKAAS